MKKGVIISIIALAIAAAGVLIAVAAFFKKQGKELRDDLDYDFYENFEDDLDDYGSEQELSDKLDDALNEDGDDEDGSDEEPWKQGLE